MTSSLSSFAHTIALTLAHSLWQGAVLWVVAAAMLHVVNDFGPRMRYALLLIAFLLLPMSAVTTFAAISSSAEHQARVDRPGDTGRLSISPELQALLKAPEPPPMPAATTEIIGTVEKAITLGWLLGVTFFSARLLFGFFSIHRLKHDSRSLPTHVERIVDRLLQRLDFRMRPAVRHVERISQAMAVGVFRQLILLPTSWLSELQPEVLEAVLAHELAHVRRWDLPVNLLQRLVEATFFFHPAVWRCSRRLRIEREMCCDAIAWRSIGDRAQYAKALTFLATLRLSPSESLLVATFGGDRMILRERIRNVLGSASTRSWFYGPSCALVGGACASVVWFAFGRAKPELPAENPRSQPRVIASQPPRVLSSPQEVVELVKSGFPNEDAVVEVEAPNADHMVDLPPYVIEAPDVLAIEVVSHGEGDQAPPHAERIRGEFLVGPDGAIQLPKYGRVQVSGLTITKAQQAVGSHIQQCSLGVDLEQEGQAHLPAPTVSLDVAGYNSKVYYIVFEDSARGDMIHRVPITGQETVLDGLAQLDNFNVTSDKILFVARPASADGSRPAQVLPVDLRAIIDGHDAHSNWQIFPGDRIFIADRKSFDPNSGTVAERIASAAAGAAPESVANSLENVALFLRAGAGIDWF